MSESNREQLIEEAADRRTITRALVEWRAFKRRLLRRHHWLLVTTVFLLPAILLDLLTSLHHLAFVLAVSFALQLADDRDGAAA